MVRFALALITLALASCSSLPVPGSGPARGDAGAGPAARQVLARSTATHGDAWGRYRRVEVGYDGEWTGLVRRLQPVLVDAGFRKSSSERYDPATGRVVQIHSGPQGTKRVERLRPRTTVSFNGQPSGDPEVLDSAALVADAYTIFLFGPSWLLDHGRDLRLLDDRTLDGDRCRLVEGRLSPGIGNSPGDHFIAWIDSGCGTLRRFQFTMNGLASTAGADVDVTFSDHWRSADGTLWPGRFVEYVRRPVLTKAHDWRMTSLTLDGRQAGPR